MPKTVLIVEDEALIVKVLTIRLEGLGYKVLAAYDGEAGLEMAKSTRPDLAVLDIGLPKLDGNTLCELLKTEPETKGIKVIMLTGKKLVGDMETAFKSGADVYVNKPYEWPRLLAQVKKLLGEHA